jgi:type VII secretion integral membrane protein EccD
MTTATSASRRAPRADVCRLTVAGLSKRADVAVPMTMAIGELLPVVLPHVTDEDERARPWVLQRLGGAPLDTDGTAGTLNLRDGETLYLRPAAQALPAIEFDDIAVGVAACVQKRGDRVGPAVIRHIILAAGCTGLAGFAAACLVIRPGGMAVPAFGAAAVIMIAVCAALSRVADGIPTSIAAGLYGCAFAALAGLSVSRADGALDLGRKDVLLAGAAAVVAAAVILAAARVPVAPFGAVLAIGVFTLVGAGLTLAFHWKPAWSAGLVAVVVFIAGSRVVQMALRAARVRVPLLPRTSAELLEDAGPEPAQQLARRTETALGYLDSLVLSSAATFAAASAFLALGTQWADWVLALSLSGAALLRGRGMGGIWQCAAMTLSGSAGLVFVLIVGVHRAGSPAGAALAVAAFAVAAALLASAAWLPGRRHAPVWGQLADRLEMLTALALVPLLLQVLHVYAQLRSLSG